MVEEVLEVGGDLLEAKLVEEVVQQARIQLLVGVFERSLADDQPAVAELQLRVQAFEVRVPPGDRRAAGRDAVVEGPR